MKLGNRRAHRYESGPNMTPLVDVVMVILIFLMLVGTFAGGEWYLQQNTGLFDAGTKASRPPPPGFVPDEPIVIRVSQPSPDTFEAQADRIKTGDKLQLIAQLTKLRADLQSIGKPLDKLAVVIQPRPDVRHKHYMSVYEAALSAGFTKVSFAVSS